MNCKHCNKGFSCGCQKTNVNGAVVDKTCAADYQLTFKENQLKQENG